MAILRDGKESGTPPIAIGWVRMLLYKKKRTRKECANPPQGEFNAGGSGSEGSGILPFPTYTLTDQRQESGRLVVCPSLFLFQPA